jgi:hypothetical protein
MPRPLALVPLTPMHANQLGITIESHTRGCWHTHFLMADSMLPHTSGGGRLASILWTTPAGP